MIERNNYLDKIIKSKENGFPKVITVIRRCGKTKSIREFAVRNNLDLIEINFWTNPEYSYDVDGELDVDTLINNISLRFPNKDKK